ncbi:MAG: AEC family transporter [Deltaproteobacteria bacterium]|nr:MAG: AEC family transporter [Deltaproteobacteria bacterium]
MIVNNLFPVLALIGLGHLLKRGGFTSDQFLKMSDRLVYFIFFPVLLFWKIGATPLEAGLDWGYCKAAACVVVGVFIFSLGCIKWLRIGDFQAGTFAQSCFRFNTYIGVAVVMNALGESGVRYFGILIGLMIPLINVLAVSTLIWFSGRQIARKERFLLTIRALISNPLIIACVSGMLYAKYWQGFPVFLENTFRLAASVTLPLALLSIGGALTFKTLLGHLSLSFVAAGGKLILFPLLGIFFLSVFGVTGMTYKVAMLFFAMPTSTAIFVLSSQLNSDTDLASATIVLSTMVSFFSLSAVLVWIA